MRALPSAVAAHISAGGAVAVHTLVWITARNRADNTEETLGLWTGPDVIVHGGRTYYGAGALLDLDPITSNLTPREVTWSFRVSPVDDAVLTVVRAYNARLAPVEVYEWWHNPETAAPLADPVRVFRGTIFTVDLPEPAVGGDATATITCVSDSWRLTKPLTLVRSQAALSARASGDLARQYNSLVGVPVQWGEGLVASPRWTSTPRPATPSTTVLPVTPTGSPPPPTGGVGEWT